MTTSFDLVRGLCDNGYPYVPGIPCWDCGKFVGRNGWIEIEHFEMSSAVASVEGHCVRCIAREAEAEAEAAALATPRDGTAGTRDGGTSEGGVGL